MEWMTRGLRLCFVYGDQTRFAAGGCACPVCGVSVRYHRGGGYIFPATWWTAGADATPGIETTQDIGTYFTGYGFETDLSTAAVDKVKIPKKWG